MASSTQEEQELRKEGTSKDPTCPSPVPPAKAEESVGEATGSATEAIARSLADVDLWNPGSAGIAANTQHDQQFQSLPAVRFKSTIEEIGPNDAASTGLPIADGGALGDPGQVTPEDIRNLSDRLRACPLQERRLNIFSYEPFSLPPSRVRNSLSGVSLAWMLVGSVVFVCISGRALGLFLRSSLSSDMFASAATRIPHSAKANDTQLTAPPPDYLPR